MKASNNIRTIWKYSVKSEYLIQFQQAYGPNGDWAELFKNCPGFIKTEFQRDTSNPNLFITIDVWESYEHFINFKDLIVTKYRLLDKICEEFTDSEEHIGVFECLDDEKPTI